jgi:ATP-dependent DNA ligase
MNTYTFESLYGYDVNGKMKKWNISVICNDDHSVIKTEYGYINGKMTTSLQVINSGKNLGKKNKTTHYEQAICEAQSKWNKKCDGGYSKQKGEDPINKKEEEPINNIENVITFPMLAQDFNKHKNKLVYPCYIQPKLDGYRMLYNTKSKYCNSRQGKEFEIIRKTDLYKELINTTAPFDSKLNNQPLILDGELYIHNGVFENLGILRKKKLSGEDFKHLNLIEYHVYDIVIPDLPYEKRYLKLVELFKTNQFKKIKLVSTRKIDTEKDLKVVHQDFIKDNYEGSIVRNNNGIYRCGARSSDLLKYKDFEDSEFKIVDFTFEKDTKETLDTKTKDNLIVWVCETESGNNFHVRPKGTREERQALYKRGNEFIGRNLQVKYFELTENGIPRFPTTKTNSYMSYIRDIVE